MKRPNEYIPTFMPTSNRPTNDDASINDDTSRLDAIAKVTGRAKYSRDYYPDNCLFVRFITCPWGTAELRRKRERAASNVPGVVEVAFNGDSGRYHGHTVGYIVAENIHALRRGYRALGMRWRTGMPDTQITDVVDGPPDPSTDTRRLLDGADHVLEAVYSTPVQTHVSLETHGVMVDHRGDSATVYATTQGTFSVHNDIGDALELPASAYETRCDYIGGGFGSKFGAGKEGLVAAEVARKYKRPVWLFRERDEEHLDTGNRPSSRTYVKIGFRADGTILGGHIQTYGGVGVGAGGGGVRCPSGQHELGDVKTSHEDVSFNGGAPRPMRAPGWPQGVFTEELMLDEVAAIAGVDPIDLRLRTDTSEARRKMYELGAKLIGWENRRANGSQSGVRRRGYGVGACSWGRFPSDAEAEVVINRDGSVEARSGTQDIGTGQRTVMGVVAADALGVPLRFVNAQVGSSRLPVGPASGGSVTAHNTAPAMDAAGRDAKRRLLEMIANRIGADASEFDIVDGTVVRKDESFMEWADACRRIGAGGIVGRGRWNRQMQVRDESKGHSDGVQLAEIEVDTETGVIHVKHIVAIQACGRVVCRKTAESQIIGGAIQGLSFALFEDKILDRNTGAMVNPNMEMYKIAGTADMPHIEPVLWTENQTGVRSLGEPPAIPTAAAIAGALFNAIGTPVRHLPLTPDKVLAAMEGGAA